MNKHVSNESVETVIEGVLARYNYNRSNLITVLQEVQKIYGYLPRKALEIVGRRLGFSFSEILNVATFYHQFRLEPTGMYIMYVCFGTACYLRGSSDVYDVLRSSLNIREGSTTASDGSITVEKARCFGCCSLAPVVMVISNDGLEKYVHGNLTPSDARKMVQSYRYKIFSKGGFTARHVQQ